MLTLLRTLNSPNATTFSYAKNEYTYMYIGRILKCFTYNVKYFQKYHDDDYKQQLEYEYNNNMCI